MRKIVRFTGICCANCAAKLERALERIDGVCLIPTVGLHNSFNCCDVINILLSTKRQSKIN